MRILSVATGTVLTLCAFFYIFGRFGTYFWLAELSSHFVLQYLITSLICGLIFLVLRSSRGVIVALILFLMCFSSVYPLVRKNNGIVGTDLRVMFFNMWVGNTNYETIAKTIFEENPDIVVVEEVAGVSYGELARVLGARYPHSGFRRGPTDYFDIAFFSKIEPLSSDVHYVSNEKIPTLDLTFEQGSQIFHIIGVHTRAPLDKEKERVRNEHLDAIASLAKSMDGPVIIGGDFNVSPWSPIWEKFVSTSGFVDGRVGNGVLSTWPVWLPSPMRIPIDQVLVSPGSKVAGMHTGKASGSDHFPIIADIKL